MKLRILRGILLISLVFTLGISQTVAAEEPLDCGAKLLAVTFDDGPCADTVRLLDALKENQAHVTFFVLGKLAENRPDIVERAYAEGHQIASHSWNHAKLTALSSEALQNDLNRTAQTIRGITGQDDVYLRPPYGSYNDAVRAYASGPIIFWSVDTLDWKHRNAATVKQTILDQAKDGGIILLHDIHPTSIDGFIAALGELKARGYELVTVSELLRRRGVTVEPGTVYVSAPNQGINLPPLNYDGKEYDESRLNEHWAYDAICFVKEKGIMEGTSETAFSPDKYMRRGMFVTVLARLSGEELSAESSVFSDVDAEAYYAQSVAWAVKHKIVQGESNGKFDPEGFVTREQLCVMLERYATYREEQAKNGKKEIPVFSDAEEISPWAMKAVEFTAQCGIVGGTDDAAFLPQSQATRAEVAVMLQRYYEQMEKPSLWDRFIAWLFH